MQACRVSVEPLRRLARIGGHMEQIPADRVMKGHRWWRGAKQTPGVPMSAWRQMIATLFRTGCP